MNAYTLYAASVNGTLISEISDQSIDGRVQEILQGDDGSVRPTFAAVMSQEPMASFTSHAVHAVLNTFGIEGTLISAAVLFFQKLKHGGTRETGGSHVKMTAASGLFCPKSISARHNEEATINCECYFTSDDGATDPLVFSKNQALIGTPAVTEKWTVGPVIIDGTDYQTVGIDFDFGIQTLIRGHSGLPYPSFAGVTELRPSVNVSSLDMALLDDVGINGKKVTDTEIYLRKIQEGTTRYAPTDAVHIKFSIPEALIYIGRANATHPNEATAECTLRPTFNGTDPMIGISIAQLP